MSIFSRIFKIGQAHANKALDGMEKPEVMLDQAIRDQEKQIAEARKKIQSVIASERKQKALVMKERDNQSQWETRAQQALSAGNEELATKALVRAEEHERNAANLDPQWQGMRKDADGLKTALRKMEDELAELRRNKDIIIAQSKTAEVKKEIYEAKAKIGKNNTGDLIARMKAKAERQSYEAEAAEEMAGATGDSLESEFKSLESGPAVSAGVADKLAAMKAKLNPPTT
ncbi:MAG: PspA/IM30 family protein [Acidobacteriota bacterium]|nr:PspA/IM30 family protein [Acidobacteriota bacterium]